MTKTSKKSLLAVVFAMVLAVVCAIGAVTYAWFTADGETTGGSKDFGTITLAAATDTYTAKRTVVSSDTTTDLMPGDTLEVDFDIKKGAEVDEAMYVAFKLTVTSETAGAAALLVAPAAPTGYTGSNGTYYKTAAITDFNKVDVTLAYTIAGQTTGNNFQGATISFKLEVVAVQAANMADAAAAKAVLDTLFDAA